ncbi:MAG: chromate transporter [Eubacterium sp.]|nr:chromate transporter [Eubacterium sp.]
MKKGFAWLLSFFKIGLIGFGGGTTLIPVIEQEMVDNKKMVSKEDYDSAVIIASITPGALPVEISSGIGKIIGGTKGMIGAAVCMALPGVLLTLLLSITMSSAGAMVIRQIEILSIGITAFILSMLTRYITGTFVWAKQRNRLLLATVMVLSVFCLSAGKSIVKVLGNVGIEMTSIFSISTVHILLMAFFVIGYVGGSKVKARRVVIAVICCFFYSLFKSKAQIMNQWIGNDTVCQVLFVILCIIMIALAVYGVKLGISKDEDIRFSSPKILIKEEAAWFIFLAVASIPAFILVPNMLEYLGRGYFSSIISFGGGDAYLTVADGLFVSTGMISEEMFYGRLVTIVNVLPGSILCKTLSGIGFYMGYAHGGIIAGLAVALSGFVCSVVGSCSVISLVQYFWQIFEKLRVFMLLKSWVKAIISGLLGTVILSLIYMCQNVAKNYECSQGAVLVELLIIYIVNLVLDKTTKMSTWMRIIISCVIALIVGNIIC